MLSMHSHFCLMLPSSITWKSIVRGRLADTTVNAERIPNQIVPGGCDACLVDRHGKLELTFLLQNVPICSSRRIRNSVNIACGRRPHVQVF